MCGVIEIFVACTFLMQGEEITGKHHGNEKFIDKLVERVLDKLLDKIWPCLFCIRRLQFDYGAHHGNCFANIFNLCGRCRRGGALRAAWLATAAAWRAKAAAATAAQIERF